MKRLPATAAMLTCLALAISAWCAAHGAEPIGSLRAGSRQANFAPLGVVGQWIPGYGELVTEVADGSQAQRLGLERDDVILAVNGQRLSHRGAWNEALHKAQYGDGRITLQYRDCRTGAIAQRQTTLPTAHNLQANLASVR